MLNIVLQYTDVFNLEEAIFTSSTTTSNEAKTSARNAASDIQLQWQGPALKHGIISNVLEWIGTIDISSIPSKVASTLIANYLWGLVSRGKQGPVAVESNKTGDVAQLPAFSAAVKVKMVITNYSKTVEIEVNATDHKAIEVALQKLLTENVR